MPHLPSVTAAQAVATLRRVSAANRAPARRYRALHLLPLVLAIGVALWCMWPPPAPERHPIKVFPDSPSYVDWGYGRPPVPFLFYALVGSERGAVIAQTVLSCAAWGTLGWLALGLPGAVVALLLAAALPVVLWNYTILSESLALSLGAALLAATLALGRRWSPARYAIWAFCLLMYTGVRAENFFLVPPLFAALLVWHRRHWRTLGAVGATAAALFVVFSVVLDKQNRNWQIRMTNIVLTRVLPDAPLAHQFHTAGLPREPALLAARGRMLAAYDPTFVAATPAFQRWLDEHSRPMYLAWLRTLAPQRMLFQSMDHTLKHWPNAFNYYIAGVRLPGTAWDAYPISHAMQIEFARWLWLAAIPLASALLTRRVVFGDLFVLAYLAAVYLMAFAVFHGDTGEMDRHMVLTATLYRFAPVAALAGVWERIRRLRRGA